MQHANISNQTEDSLSRLEQALAEYMFLVDSGKSVSRDALLAKYSDVAAEIREHFSREAALTYALAPTNTLTRSTLSSADDTSPHHNKPLAEFGEYEIIREIARGGMGVVYKARHRKLDRVVALKMILGGKVSSRDQINRFYHEARAVAGLQHPGIIPVYEVGQFDGLHFFAMEYVQGASLRELTRDNPLPIRSVIAYLRQIADAVQYAHDQGILHRDLKPSNVLIDESDRARVMDFGLAKQLDDDSEMTRTGQILGTASYMPPEQALGQQKQIDERSDVYSLGALLYTLVTGRPPFQADSSAATLLQVIESEPVALRVLNRDIDRDLETICLKCLEKEPGRRYASSAALADELGRYDRGEPISARPISRTVRTWKWCKRNPVVAGLSVTVAAVLLISAIVSSIFSIEANHNATLARQQRDRADEQTLLAQGKALDANQAAKREREARKQAEAARDSAKAIKDFLVSALHSSDPERNGRTVTVANLLQTSAQQLEKSDSIQDTVRADLWDALGETHRGLGLYPEAVELFTKCRDLRSTLLGEDHPDTLSAMDELGRAHESAGQFDKAIVLHEQTLKRRRTILGTEHANTMSSMNNLASAYYAAGRVAEAILLGEQTLELRKAKLGDEHPQTLHSMTNLAISYESAGRTTDALRLRTRSLRLTREQFGDEHLETLDKLAYGFRSMGRWGQAIKVYERTVVLRRAKLGESHPATLRSMDSLASTYCSARRMADAMRLHEVTLSLRRENLNADHPDVLNSMNNLAMTYESVGRIDEALWLLEYAVKAKRTKLGKQHPSTLRSMANLARVYRYASRLKEAIQLGETTFKLQQEKLGEEHSDTMLSMGELGMAYEAAGRRDDAILLYGQSFELSQRIRGADHRGTLAMLGMLADAYQTADQLADALILYKKHYELLKKKLGDEHPDTLASMDRLIAACVRAGQVDDAEKWRNEGDRLRNLIRSEPVNVSGHYAGQSYLFRVTGTASGDVWGTDVYTSDSTLAAVAVHAGILRPGETGVVRVTLAAGNSQYTGSLKNGVQSQNWTGPSKSFQIERVHLPADSPADKLADAGT